MPPVSNKCVDCYKVVNKKQPGIECSKCRKWRHANCAGIPLDQIVLLASTECVNWVCRKCNKNPKRISIITPDQVDDEINTPTSEQPEVNSLQLIALVKAEVAKQLNKNAEFIDLKGSTQYCSDKIDDYEDEFSSYKDQLKKFESRLTNLLSKNEHLELRCNALEQRVNELEQEKLNRMVEIAGIPTCEQEDPTKIVEIVAEKIQLPMQDVSSIKRIKKTHHSKSENKQPQEVDNSLIVLTITDEEKKKNWVTAGRNAKLQSSIINCAFTGRIYLREALTKPLKTLLWETKEKLKDSYQFIWSKDGKVLIRKDEKSKVRQIRNISDLNKFYTPR